MTAAKPGAPKPATVKPAAAKPAAAKPVVSAKNPATRPATVARRKPVYRARPAVSTWASSRLNVSPSLDELPPMVAPLANLDAKELADSFFNSRGRVLHYAIDIGRPIGDPLYAVVDGVVHQMAWSVRGGRSIYLVDSDGRFRFFYCHLSKYAEGLKPGSTISRGDLIGYVGNTGNARFTAPHLHFEIVRLMQATAAPALGIAARILNPYPVLRQILETPPVPPTVPLPQIPSDPIALGAMGGIQEPDNNF